MSPKLCDPLSKNTAADQSSKFIFPSWLARTLGAKQVCIRITGREISTVLKNGTEVSSPWSQNLTRPQISKGFLFYKIEVAPSITLNFLTQQQTHAIAKQLLSGWYIAHSPTFTRGLNLIQKKLYTGYIRSSELQDLRLHVDSLVSKFQKPPQKTLLPKQVYGTYYHIYDLAQNFSERVDAARHQFVNNQCKKFERYFDEVESNPLTAKQRAACVVDDDNNLVLAGAGTGKTSVMVAKAGYLLKSRKAKPEEILILAFGNKAAKELNNRIIEKLETESVKANTFHSLGRQILQKVEKRAAVPSELASDSKRFQKFVDTVLHQLLDDEDYADIAITYFEQYLYPIKNIFDFESHGEYIDYLKNNEVRSLKGDLVKSYGELLIANFLFANGIEYKYEAKYKIDIPDSNFKSYTPDFYLPDDDVYIEHFGVDRNDNTAPWINKETYREQTEWKRQLHSENDTCLLETFYYQQAEGTLLEKLSIQLKRHGIEFSPLPKERIFETLKEFGRIEALSRLLADLISNIKSCCIDDEEIKRRAKNSSHPEHALAALALLKPIMAAYDEELGNNEEIDFNDMIHRALKYIEQGIFKPYWKYILVDEFQDIADPRARLIKSLRDKVPNCSIMCVGDDWQSIYRFTGSDLRFTTQFKYLFGTHSTSTLDKTFRFNNMIGSVASTFVSQNPSQVNKNIQSHTIVDKPAVSIFKTENCAGLDEIISVINQIVIDADNGSSVFILARFKHLLPKEFSQIKRDYADLDIQRGMTMHASKGKEADYVIIVGVEKGKFGFPSEKMTHPLLEVYLPDEEAFANAEERRLLYVAITRAKNKTYILANMKNASVFAKELLDEKYQVTVDEFPTHPSQENTEEFPCPSCDSGQLVDRESDGRKFTGCNNYPYCTYTRNNCEWCDSKLIERGEFRVCESESCDYKTKICDQCNSGNMVRRERRSDGKKFWGCSNFKGNEHHSCGNSYDYIDFSPR